jgi:hypothetical protein
MSAFTVEDKTINRVVTWLRTELNDSNYSREQPQERLSMNVVEDSFVQELGQAMFQLNIEGVNTRYADKPAAQFRKLDYAYQTEFVSDVQVLKSMRCWLYQCAEGEVPNDPLYRFFDEVVAPHLLYQIITKLPEYDQAEWG